MTQTTKINSGAFSEELENIAPHSIAAPTSQIETDFEAILGEKDPELRILIVEDDPIVRLLLETWLKAEVGPILIIATQGNEALHLAQVHLPQVIITDWHMPVMDGIQFCRALRQTEWGNAIYVLMLTASTGEDDLVQAFEAGVDDFLSKPLSRQALGARLRAAWRYVHFREAWAHDQKSLALANAEMELKIRRLQLSSQTDCLTGLPNRRAGQRALVQALAAAQRNGQQMCVLCFEIDDFQKLVARAGQETCDEVLQSVGATLQHLARDEDTLCRWYPDEFLLVAPGLKLHEGIAAAKRFRMQIAQHLIALEDEVLGVTVAVGVACWDAESKSKEQLLIEVDQALLVAKHAGGDRIACVEGGISRVI